MGAGGLDEQSNPLYQEGFGVILYDFRLVGSSAIAPRWRHSYVLLTCLWLRLHTLMSMVLLGTADVPSGCSEDC